MYRKINKGDTIKNFKPRRMVLGGNVYEVDSINTLNQIKKQIEEHKKEEEELLEEQKNQKVLVKKTRVGNLDEKTIKIISSINKIPDDNFRRSNQRRNQKIQHEEPVKPKFNLKSTACQRKSKDDKILQQTHQRIMAIKNSNENKESTIYTEIETGKNVSLVEPDNPWYNSKKVNLMTHERKSIKKNTDLLNNPPVPIKTENNKEINNTYNNYISPDEEKSNTNKLQIVSHDRKQIKNLKSDKQPEFQINQSESGNSYNNANTHENQEIEEKPKIANIIRHERKPIKSLTNLTRVNSDQTQQNPDCEENNDCNNLISNLDHDTDRSEDDDSSDECNIITKNFNVIKSQWYVLLIRVDKVRDGLVKVLDTMKRQIVPLICQYFS